MAILFPHVVRNAGCRRARRLKPRRFLRLSHIQQVRGILGRLYRGKKIPQGLRHS